MSRWHLFTGEYPPAPGGVSDYTRQVAVGLAERGETVEIWAPRVPGADPDDPGVTVHRLQSVRPDHLAELGRTIAASRARDRLFVQYVPQSFGRRGMNVELIRWLVRQPAEVWVQFHEVAFAWDWLHRPQHQIIALVQRWMSRALARRADRIFISIEGWRRQLGDLGARAEWLPIPSNIPINVPELVTARIRRDLVTRFPSDFVDGSEHAAAVPVG